MAPVAWVQEGPIAVVLLEHPPANALDLEILRDIVRTLDQVQRSDCRAVVVTGSGRVFSAGADLYRVLEEGREYLQRAGEAFSAAFESVFTFPLPVVAAVNGAAVAGGCVLVCACDYRVMAAGESPIGFAELAVGVPFPAWALEIVRAAVRPDRLGPLVLTGRLLTPSEALDAGVVDEVVEPDALLGRATEVAERLGRIPQATFRHTKRLLRAPAVERARRLAGPLDAEALEVWDSSEVRAAISEFLIRTLGSDRR